MRKYNKFIVALAGAAWQVWVAQYGSSNHTMQIVGSLVAAAGVFGIKNKI
jgi:hypothetical protein